MEATAHGALDGQPRVSLMKIATSPFASSFKVNIERSVRAQLAKGTPIVTTSAAVGVARGLGIISMVELSWANAAVGISSIPPKAIVIDEGIRLVMLIG